MHQQHTHTPVSATATTKPQNLAALLKRALAEDGVDDTDEGDVESGVDEDGYSG